MTDALMNTYASMEIAFVEGEGVWLTDDKGKRYLDALAGLGVTGLGHSHPQVTSVIQEQASKLLHTTNIYQIPAQKKLAEKLVSTAGMDRVFFGNSGAEANECAIKICRLYGKNKNVSSPTIIVTEASFHGRTLATLTATGSRKVQAGFEPLVNGFVRAPFNDVAAMKKIGENNANVVAVMLEPIQGEGGIQIPSQNYLKEVRQLCDDQGWLMVLDEVQSGNGRTGTYFNYQQHNILPDVVTTAKGLANGIPIGACLARGIAAETLKPGNHGSTFGGNPFACSVAFKVMEVIEKESLADHAAEIGAYLLASLKARLDGLNIVKEVRGVGLMLGIELNSPCPELVKKAQDKGLLINVTAEKIIRLLPPLILSASEADQISDIICSLIEQS